MKKLTPQDRKTINGVLDKVQPSQQTVKQPSVLDANATATTTVVQGSLSDEGPMRPEQDTVNEASSGADAKLPPVVLQSDLEPEIPDLSLEISESSSEEGPESHEAESGPVSQHNAMRRDSHGRFPRTSRGKANDAGEGRDPLVRCTTCGKTIFSVLGRTEELTW